MMSQCFPSRDYCQDLQFRVDGNKYYLFKHAVLASFEVSFGYGKSYINGRTSFWAPSCQIIEGADNLDVEAAKRLSILELLKIVYDKIGSDGKDQVEGLIGVFNE